MLIALLTSSFVLSSTIAPAPSPELAVVPVYARETQPLAWREEWPRFRPSEYAVTSVFAALDIAVLLLKSPENAHFTGGILFDDPVRDFARARSKSARTTAAQISDVLYPVMVAYPIVVDALITTMLVHGNYDVGFQELMIDLQSLAVTSLFTLAPEKLAGRERPDAIGCASDPNYDARCGTPKLYVSLLSGHTSTTVTTAGLICAHHAHLQLYGSELADRAACYGSIAIAATTGVLRLVSDAHWATDVLSGAIVGFISGYVLPMTLHYTDAPKVAIVPWRNGDVSGLQIAGAF